MRAVTQDAYGSTDVLQVRDIGRPDIGEDEVLVRVRAAGVDRGVWHLMAGLPYVTRLMFGLRAPRNPVPGMDLAGVVEVCGAKITRFEPGDEVFGIGVGAFAEYARASQDKLTAKPRVLSFEQAAVMPISGSTALQGLRDHARVRSGQHVLVVGASGGVGSYGVQIAKSFGATVTGVCSTTKVDLVRSLGSDHVMDYTRQDFADGREHYDVILDTGGNTPLSRLRRALASDGTLVIVGGEGGGRWIGGVDRQARAMLVSPFVGQQLRAFLNDENHEDIAALAELAVAGDVVPALDRTFPLEQAAKAIRYLEEGHARGKVAITI